MFSITPSTGTAVLRNMPTPRRTSASATSCGVETITAPSSGSFCTSVSCTSPVPGGVSMNSRSRSPQSVSVISWLTADITIGPRQTTA